MANIYVRSTDGSDADNGSTWALAKATLAAAAAIDAAGDNVYLSSVHAESTASTVTVTLNGTNANPVRVLSVDDSAEPPTAEAAGASVTTTGNSTITLQGSAYWRGIAFSAGTGSVNASLVLNPYNGASNTRQVYERCTLLALGTGSTASIKINQSAGANVIDNETLLQDCILRSSTNSSSAVTIEAIGRVEIRGGAYPSGGPVSVGAFITPPNLSGRGLFARVSGFDLSQAPAGISLFKSSSVLSDCAARNCKLPASWTGSLVTGTPTIGDRFAMYNCDSGDTNYRLWVQTFYGSILDETTIVRTGGASDGTTPLAWKMVSNSSAAYPLGMLESPEIVRWNDITGSSITVTVEVITDNVTLKDDECWLEVQYLGTSGGPLGTFASDAKADVLATASNQATSTETWTTTGLTTPVKQKLSVSFTPQEKGFIHAVVKLARASTTVYVCPKLDVT